MNSLPTSNKFADFMRLANLRGLSNSRLGEREDKELATMQNPDLSGSAMNLPPPYSQEQIPGNFDVRANQKIELPVSNPEPPMPLPEGDPMDDMQSQRSLPTFQPNSNNPLTSRVPDQVNEMARNGMLAPSSRRTAQAPPNLMEMIATLSKQVPQQAESVPDSMDGEQNQRSLPSFHPNSKNILMERVPPEVKEMARNAMITPDSRNPLQGGGDLMKMIATLSQQVPQKSESMSTTENLDERSPVTMQQATSLVNAQPNAKNILMERVPPEVKEMARNAMISPDSRNPLQGGKDPMEMIAMLANQENPQESPVGLPQNPNEMQARVPEFEQGGKAQLDPNSPVMTQQEQVAPVSVGEETQPGAVSEVMSNPTLKSKIDDIFGPIDPGMADAASSYENAMKAYSDQLDNVTAGLTDQEKAIRDRIESRNLTTQDKILMALALIAPAIISGLIGGKEGLMGALAGGAEAFANISKEREKESKEDQEALTSFAVDKSKVAKEKAGIHPEIQKFKAELAKSIPNKDLREIFNRDGQILNNRLVINSGNPNLPIKSDAIRDMTDYKRIKKEIPKFATSLSATEQGMKVIDSMHSLLDAANASINNKNILQKGLSYLPFYDSSTGGMKAFFPYTRDTVKDADGKEYKISELYRTLRTQLSDIWRKGQNNNANAFKSTEEHFFQQLPDPFGKMAFLEGRSDINQNKKQLDFVKDKFADNIISYLDEQGIDTTSIQRMLSSSARNTELREDQRKRDRVNAAVQQSTGGN